ncbi:AimR family lysis-lysogeny pheromone receptor [Aquibacillus sp. 3ASR75-11]|uniref:AimR family lysis-lysogeny pheromone receptor n=1 Tax=Terrihalobacillus insolitus TaxID=2950438 RepID=A0A9X3WSP6_9BACI|nr:AimR family lysis-lysogeny pheromone receptor [Terrihalobacillus insolitus]MDC3411806.1 AimR family lysis-lysogeny pheromone receptor [Terrihalobacillus insolitus]MDC3425015.1 AimR family lysis-lysogeny pheromone receptor [Terrihalobacillus insolitus]
MAKNNVAYDPYDIAYQDILTDFIDSREITLNQFIKQMSLHYRDELVMQLTRKFTLESESSMVQKEGMEFLYMNGYDDDLRILIQKNFHSMNMANNRWAYVYELLLERKRRLRSPRQLIHLVEKVETESPELKCLVGFLRIYCYYDMFEFDMLGNYLEELNESVSEVDNPFMSALLYVRLQQVLFIYYWKRNEIIIARKHAFRILSRTYNLDFQLNTHINLALTYTFDSYTQAMNHLNEAVKIAKQCNQKRLLSMIYQQNLPFISAHFGMVDGIASDDPSEQAHIEIAKQNFVGASKILDNVSINSPFRKYYLGLAHQDKDILLEAHKDFIEKRSDYFFSKLPLNAIQQFC